jgi:hypothetical protein
MLEVDLLLGVRVKGKVMHYLGVYSDAKNNLSSVA